MFGVFEFGAGYFGQPEPEEEQQLPQEPVCDWPTLQKLLGRRKKRRVVLEPAPEPELTAEQLAAAEEAIKASVKAEKEREEIRQVEEVLQVLAILDAADQAEQEAAERHALVLAAWTVYRRRQLAIVEKALAGVGEQSQDLEELREGLEECRAELAEK